MPVRKTILAAYVDAPDFWTTERLREELRLWVQTRQELGEALDLAMDKEGVGELEDLSSYWEDTVHDYFGSDDMIDTIQEALDLRRTANPNLIPGGLAAGRKLGEFEEEALFEGIAVELEHSGTKGKLPTARELALAAEIAADHLTERSDYYDVLRAVELNRGRRHKRRRKGSRR